MIKKISLIIFCFFFMTIAYAKSNEESSSLTHVVFTNNTKNPITVHSTLTTNDANFKQGKDWDQNALTLAPYETKEVLWFSRNQDVKKDELYQFDLFVNHENYSEDLKISFQERGKTIYGSDVVTSLTFPAGINQIIPFKNSLEKLSANFWGNHHQVYARSWVPTGQTFNNYHFVIDQPENNSYETSAKNTISVLTYNVQLLPLYANVEDDLNHPSTRAEDIPPKIKQYDVVILEELFDHHLREKTIDLMQAAYPYHTQVVGYNTHKVWSGGVMIFSKWPILKEDEVVYQESAGADALAAKGAGYAAVNKNGKIYHIIGTHLQAGNEEDMVVARKHQIEELASFIGRLAIPANEPLLLGGDFNVNQFKSEIDTLLTTLNVSLFDNIGYPYSVDGSINTMKVGSGHGRIDYVFYSNSHAIPKIALNKVYILRDFDNEAMWPQFDLSDHFPLDSFFDFT